MVEIIDEVKKIYEEERVSLKKEIDSLLGEIKINIDLRKNESYKEVESK